MKNRLPRALALLSALAFCATPLLASSLDGQGKKKEPPKPIYKKWWFWTGVGVVAVGGTAAIYASGGGRSPPGTDLGNIVFGK